ncbi:MAG: hypothetical protein ACRDS9_27985 [Pseudonocardiaceae bacterium]
MTAPTYRPGDVAMVDNEPGVFCHMVNHDGSETRFFALLNGYVALVDDRHEIGSVLGNVTDLLSKHALTDRAERLQEEATADNRRPEGFTSS